MQKHGNLHDFLTNLLENKTLHNVDLLQVGFLDDLMNGFNIYKKLREQIIQQIFIYIFWEIRRGLFITYF